MNQICYHFNPPRTPSSSQLFPDDFLGICTECWKDQGGPSPWEGLIKTILKESSHLGPLSSKKAVYSYISLTDPPVINDLNDNFSFSSALRKSFVFLSMPTSYNEFLWDPVTAGLPRPGDSQIELQIFGLPQWKKSRRAVSVIFPNTFLDSVLLCDVFPSAWLTACIMLICPLSD